MISGMFEWYNIYDFLLESKNKIIFKWSSFIYGFKCLLNLIKSKMSSIFEYLCFTSGDSSLRLIKYWDLGGHISFPAVYLLFPHTKPIAIHRHQNLAFYNGRQPRERVISTNYCIKSKVSKYNYVKRLRSFTAVNPLI